MSTISASNNNFVSLLTTSMDNANNSVTCEIKEAINLNKTQEVRTHHVIYVFFDDNDYLTTSLFIHGFQTKLVEHVKTQPVCKLLRKRCRCDRFYFTCLQVLQEA